jgi:2-polyprenyl-3-methyl-5-hydroxy-6-metoxy-1,4-benzoquinol methylase
MGVSRAEVILAYRLLLGREAEAESVINFHMNSVDLNELRERFIGSREFVRKSQLGRVKLNVLPLDLPKIEVDTDATNDQLVSGIAKVKATWTDLGILKPHFSVLTNPEFLPENLAQGIDKFWDSGEVETTRVQRILERHEFADLSDKTCVEFGCGVGRVTMGLARRFSQVHGYDISAGHLAYAKQRAQDIGINNVVFHQCSENILEDIQPCDVFYSRIVFQHNPPIIITQLIKKALRGLRP